MSIEYLFTWRKILNSLFNVVFYFSNAVGKLVLSIYLSADKINRLLKRPCTFVIRTE